MGTKNKTKSEDVDLRTLPKDERPKPTSGQSRAEFALPKEELTKYEMKIIEALNGKGKGLRETIPVLDLSKATRMTKLEVRNTIRRLVPSTWVERVDEVLTDDGDVKKVRGHYRITERGRKRLGA